MNNFDLKNFLVENKLTSNSKRLALVQEQEPAEIEETTLSDSVDYHSERESAYHEAERLYDAGYELYKDGVEANDQDMIDDAEEMRLQALNVSGLEESDFPPYDMIDDPHPHAEMDNLENQYRQVLDKIDFKKVVDRYAPPEIEALPGVDDYIDAWKDSGGLDPEFLDPDKMLKDLINYASNL
jgi:hypothetical protein